MKQDSRLEKLSNEEIEAIKRLRSQQFARAADDRPFSFKNASEKILSGFKWKDEDFSQCDLRTANLSGCTFEGADFRNADLWNADLSESDLTDARNLFPEQLAATNLRGTKLPENLTKFEALAAAEHLSDNASKVLLTIVGAVVYTFLTIPTTKDIQLMTNANSISFL